jgi:hypothetical protein
MLRPLPRRTARPECLFVEACPEGPNRILSGPKLYRVEELALSVKAKVARRAGRWWREATSGGAGCLLIEKPRREFGEAADGDGFADAAHEVEVEADVVLRVEHGAEDLVG